MAGRPKGAKAHDHEEKRSELLRRLRELCFENPAERLSMRQMATGIGVSVPTLKNYFADRDAIVEGILEQCWRDASALLAHSVSDDETVGDRISRELDQLLLGVTKFGLDRLQVWGMNEGLSSPPVGVAYLKYFLEPTLQGAEKWLGYYQEKGEISADVNVRHAALSFFAPCLVLIMHQNYLGGDDFRHADLAQFFKEHGERFEAYLREPRKS